MQASLEIPSGGIGFTSFKYLLMIDWEISNKYWLSEDFLFWFILFLAISFTWLNFDGELKISGTLTIQEQGSVTGSIEYQNLHIKLGGKITGDIKVSEKIKKITDAIKSPSTSMQDSVKEQKK